MSLPLRNGSTVHLYKREHEMRSYNVRLDNRHSWLITRKWDQHISNINPTILRGTNHLLELKELQQQLYPP